MKTCGGLRPSRSVLAALAAASIGSAWSCSNPAAPAPPSEPPPANASVLVGAGDIALCGSPGAEATARLLDAIGGVVFTAGDNVYPSGGYQDFRECYDRTWGRHKDRTRPTPGNHDYETPGAAAYYAYFDEAAGPDGLGYYVYNVGPWRVIGLNSEIAVRAGSPQYQWLRG